MGLQGKIEFESSGEVKYYSEWAVPMLGAEKSKLASLYEVVKDFFSKKKVIRQSDTIIGFIPYIEYIKPFDYGNMKAGKVYVHSFGNPAFLVFDKSDNTIKIRGVDISFGKEGIKG